jgi:hypothetical protein
MSPAALESRLVALILPGETWGAVFSSHAEWAVTALDQIEEQDRERVARQLCLLFAAAENGASPDQDDLITEMRQLRDAACQLLGHTPDRTDTQWADRFVLRHETLKSLVTKLANAAGVSLGGNDVQDARSGAGRDAGHAEGAGEDGQMHRPGGA